MAINTYGGNKRVYSIDPRGGYSLLNFEFGKETEVDLSCSIQWQNYLYVFGGFTKRRQVSMVNGSRLEQKATLDFDFFHGACTVLNQITIVLCFGEPWKRDVCRQSNNPLGSFTKLSNSNYWHRYTRIASFDGKNKIY